MLTAKDTEVDKITGLTIGADDYIAKTLSPTRVNCASQGAVTPI